MFGVNGRQLASNYHPYPAPLATYEDVVASPDLFIDTLKKHHTSMGTKFMKPVVGGKHLDLHLLFAEVTSRGGIAKVLKERKWKEVNAVFEFPSSATNASFILRKYYISLLYHYEQIYMFRAKCFTPPTDAVQQLSTTIAPRGYEPSAASPQQKSNTSASMPQVSLAAPSAGSPVCGVIDGKFDGGYLITVKIGLEELKGVLYQVPDNESHKNHSHHLQEQTQAYSSSVQLGVPRRKRRKKSEIRKRDPSHPKPNRSGYNFFFAEQHAKLKPLYHGKDREISRIIGELWNKLQEPDRAVYQEKAMKDKERYKIEMEDYRERLRNVSMALTQESPPVQKDLISNVQLEGAASAYMEENESSSDKSDKNNLEEYDSEDKEQSDDEEYSRADTELKNVNIEIMSDEAFDLQTRLETCGRGTRDEFNTNDGVLGEDGISVPIEQIEQHPSNDLMNLSQASKVP